jgi:hypothetical protein
MDNEVYTQNEAQSPAPKKKMNGVLKGCLIAFVIFVIVGLIAGGVIAYISYKAVGKFKDAFLTEFAEAGYNKITGQSVIVSSRVEGNTMYIVQSVNIQEEINGSLAILGQTGEISSLIWGNVDFKGSDIDNHR